ncbi:MAG: hypothetical protein SPJ49_01500, partial [Bacilli bacterium]|nr:hypothetical protein [Bacilli bacterium]
VDITKEASWSLSKPDAGLIYEGEVALNDYVGQLTIYATYEDVTGLFNFEVLTKEVQPPIDDPNEDTPNDEELNNSDKGCKGSIYGTSSIISILCLFGLILLKFKRI